MKYKNIIFDLDGTLLDTSEGVKEAVLFTIKKLGYSKLEHDNLDAFIGPPIQTSLINFYNCTKEEAQKGADIFREYYKNVSLFKASAYPGIYSVIQFIKEKNMNVAVATYKREDYAIKLLNKFRFNEYCKVMHGGDNFNKLSKADIIKICIDELGGDIDNSLYVGDTYSDLKGANECGIDFIGVTYGFGFKPNKIYEFKTVKSCNELEKVIKD